MVQSFTTTPSMTPSSQKVSKVEGIKERSNYLREPLATELLEDTTHFSHDAYQILKFHGSYQQDNRENRVKGQEKDYQMMLRTRSPGGFIPPQLYLTLERLSEEYGNHTLRVTTRQGFQMHGILKKNLKTTIQEIVQNMGSTLGACGDLNRNVMAPPAPFANRVDYDCVRRYANTIADLLTPQTGAYYEIWLDGEKALSGEEHPEVKAARQRNGNGTIFSDSPNRFMEPTISPANSKLPSRSRGTIPLIFIPKTWASLSFLMMRATWKDLTSSLAVDWGAPITKRKPSPV